jgi:hypothetical protein
MSVYPGCIRKEARAHGQRGEEVVFKRAIDHAKPVASEIFASLGEVCPELIAIVIDYVADLVVLKRVPFLRSKETDCAGSERFVGLPVDLATIRDCVPDCGESGILEGDVHEIY